MNKGGTGGGVRRGRSGYKGALCTKHAQKDGRGLDQGPLDKHKQPTMGPTEKNIKTHNTGPLPVPTLELGYIEQKSKGKKRKNNFQDGRRSPKTTNNKEHVKLT